MKTISIYTIIILSLAVCCACDSEFLDVKPRKSLVVPTTLEDFQALLNRGESLTNLSPGLQMIAADNRYRLPTAMESLSPRDRGIYLWEQNPYSGESLRDWNTSYEQIFYTNIVLDGLHNYPAEHRSGQEYNKIKGYALFHRAVAFFGLAQLFTKAYDPSTANQDLGIPLRLSSSVSQIVERSSLQQTYDRIIQDLELALGLIPDDILETQPYRPSKAAVHGMLARVYLSMGRYEEALLHADACLAIKSTLFDFNELDVASNRPIPPSLPTGNQEVIYHLTAMTPAYVTSPTTRMDTLLYDMYDDNDLRKQCFFRSYNGGYIFKGSYTGNVSPFGGLATDEMYLIKSECLARAGQVTEPLTLLNKLLLTRWDKSVEYVPIATDSPKKALDIILEERRKELVGRGLRWGDIKRLNVDPLYGDITLQRMVDGQPKLLPPNDSRFVFPIPDDEIRLSGIEQNAR